MQSSLQAWFHYVKAQCCLRDHILVLNMHTGGEPANLILNCGDLPGATMREKVNQVSQSDGDYRYLHQTLMEAPVGHRDALAAVITDPIDGYGSDFGVFFIDTGGTLDMCGDNIFAASIGLTELKLTTANPVLFDTASAGGGKDGVVGLHLKMDGDDVVNTTMNNVESFVLPEHQGEVSIDCPGIGRVSCHYKIAYGGNLFAIIDADSMMVNKQKGIVVEPKNNQLFLDAGDMLRDHIRQEMGTVQIGKDSKQVDLVSFYSTKVQPNADTNIALVLKNTVVFGKQGALSLNRSPCGTGTCAQLALLTLHNKIKPGDTFRYDGILNAPFYGRFTATNKGVLPKITATSFMVGLSQYLRKQDVPSYCRDEIKTWKANIDLHCTIPQCIKVVDYHINQTLTRIVYQMDGYDLDDETAVNLLADITVKEPRGHRNVSGVLVRAVESHCVDAIFIDQQGIQNSADVQSGGIASLVTALIETQIVQPNAQGTITIRVGDKIWHVSVVQDASGQIMSMVFDNTTLEMSYCVGFSQFFCNEKDFLTNGFSLG